MARKLLNDEPGLRRYPNANLVQSAVGATNATNATPATDNSNTNYWQLYQARIAENNVNQKAELAAINQRANSYTNAYLKSLGLGGTSAGASQIAENSLNLANSYNQLNANRDQLIEQERARNESALSQAYNNALDKGESARYLEDLLSRYDDNSLSAGYKQQLRDFAGSAGTWENDRKVVLEDIETQLDNVKLNGYQKAQVQELISNLDNAKTSEEYYAIADEYADVISDITTIAKDLSQSEINSKIANNDYQASYSASDLASLIRQRQSDYDVARKNAPPMLADNQTLQNYFRSQNDLQEEINKLKSMANKPKEGKTYKIGNKTYYYSKGKFYQL